MQPLKKLIFDSLWNHMSSLHSHSSVLYSLLSHEATKKCFAPHRHCGHLITEGPEVQIRLGQSQFVHAEETLTLTQCWELVLVKHEQEVNIW